MTRLNNEGKGFIKTLLGIIVAIGIVGAIAGGGSSDSEGSSSGSGTTSTKKGAPAEPTPAPEFVSVTADELKKALDENALKAENTYNDSYLEVKGRLSVIDSDGKYISLASMNDFIDLTGVQCYIKNDEQRNQVMEMKKDDIITVRIHITKIGEIMGYSGDIIEFVQ